MMYGPFSWCDWCISMGDVTLWATFNWKTLELQILPLPFLLGSGPAFFILLLLQHDDKCLSLFSLPFSFLIYIYMYTRTIII